MLLDGWGGAERGDDVGEEDLLAGGRGGGVDGEGGGCGCGVAEGGRGGCWGCAGVEAEAELGADGQAVLELGFALGAGEGGLGAGGGA